jgi:hypothetical protein
VSRATHAINLNPGAFTLIPRFVQPWVIFSLSREVDQHRTQLRSARTITQLPAAKSTHVRKTAARSKHQQRFRQEPGKQVSRMTRVSGSANGQHNPATPSTEAVGVHSQPAQLFPTGSPM